MSPLASLHLPPLPPRFWELHRLPNLPTLLALLALLLWPSACQSIPADQQAVLTYLKSYWALADSSWPVPTPCSASAMCDQLTVCAVCDANGNLVSLQFNFAALGGTTTVPTRMGQLVTLTGLKFFYSGLTGDLPDQMSLLINLASFDSSGNSLTTVPTVLGQIPSLQSLTLFGDSISGTLPHSLSNLHQLRTFQVSLNSLHGVIPASYASLAALEYFAVEYNHFSSFPSELTNLTALTKLSLRHNSFTGDIPSALGSISNLRSLVLSFNAFTGTLPDALSSLAQLTTLDVGSGPSLTSSVPQSYSKLTNLVEFNLDGNSITGFPDGFSILSALSFLSVQNNQLSSFPTCIGALAQLQNLNLNGNSGISSPIPTQISSLLGLTSLLLNSCGLTGTILTQLSRLLNLQALSMSGNSFTSTLPEGLANLLQLTLLVLSSSHITGSVPSAFGLLTNLQVLDLSHNLLTSTFPSTLGLLTQLSVLSLSSNQVGGSYPGTLGNLVFLQGTSLDTDLLVCPPLRTSCDNRVQGYFYSIFCTTTCAPFCNSCIRPCEIIANVQFRGVQLGGSPVGLDTQDSCCTLCLDTPNCVAWLWTVSSSQCSTFSSLTAASVDTSSAYVSGLKKPSAGPFCRNPCGLRMGATCAASRPGSNRALCSYYASPCCSMQCSCEPGFYAVCSPTGQLLTCAPWDPTINPVRRVQCPK